MSTGRGPARIVFALSLSAAAFTACSDSSDDTSRKALESCTDEPSAACIADVASFDSEFLIELGELDGSGPREVAAGACAGSGRDAEEWTLCVVPLADGRQVVVGRAADDDLLVRTTFDDTSVEFLLANDPGEATVISGQSQDFQVVDSTGSVVGGAEGSGLIEPTLD